MASVLQRALALIRPRNKNVGEGIALTPTWWWTPPGAWRPLPSYRDHLVDLSTQRLAYSSQTLMDLLGTHDPDVSSAIHANLTVAATDPIVLIRDTVGNLVPGAYKAFYQMIQLLTHELDPTKGYQRKATLRWTSEQLRYMVMLRGACALELVTDTNFVPTELRLVDPASVRWIEDTPGNYKPIQFAYGLGVPIDLDIPTFYWAYHRTSPISVYPYSPFVSAINTITARQQAISDLFRIMRINGSPRVEVKVIEQVIKNSAPANIQQNPDALRAFVNQQIMLLQNQFAGIQADQAIVHTDAVELSVLNERTPGLTMNVEPVIATFNAQNQAALKTMSTILGRGESGVNTASVEARMFSLHADALNHPVAEALSRAFTFALRLVGYPVTVELKFRPAELRPDTELEPMRMVRQSRVLQALSLGMMTDEEAHLELFGRLPPPGTPKLSGTNFQAQTGAVDTDAISPNSDPMGRSVAPAGTEAAKSNSVRPKGTPK